MANRILGLSSLVGNTPLLAVNAFIKAKDEASMRKPKI